MNIMIPKILGFKKSHRQQKKCHTYISLPGGNKYEVLNVRSTLIPIIFSYQQWGLKGIVILNI